jgi:hypothetical protein
VEGGELPQSAFHAYHKEAAGEERESAGLPVQQRAQPFHAEGTASGRGGREGCLADVLVEGLLPRHSHAAFLQARPEGAHLEPQQQGHAGSHRHREALRGAALHQEQVLPGNRGDEREAQQVHRQHSPEGGGHPHWARGRRPEIVGQLRHHRGQS